MDIEWSGPIERARSFSLHWTTTLVALSLVCIEYKMDGTAHLSDWIQVMEQHIHQVTNLPVLYVIKNCIDKGNHLIFLYFHGLGSSHHTDFKQHEQYHHHKSCHHNNTWHIIVLCHCQAHGTSQEQDWSTSSTSPWQHLIKSDPEAVSSLSLLAISKDATWQFLKNFWWQWWWHKRSTKAGGWTPVMTGDRMEAMTCLKCSKQGKKQGEMGNLGLQKGELCRLLHIAFSQEGSDPGSGKPMAIKW